MARLTNPTDTLVKLQSRLYRVDAENRDLRGQINSLLNRVAAAEGAARAATEAYQTILREKKELEQLLENR